MAKQRQKDQTPQDIDIDADVAVPMRLPQQQICGIWIPNGYEVWKTGIYKRKKFSVDPDDGAPPEPNVDLPCPLHHEIKNLKKIAGRPAYLCGIGHRLDDDKDLVGIRYFHGADPDDQSLTPEERMSQSMGGRVRGEKWPTLWVSHAQISGARELNKLSDNVLPVNSNNAAEMVQFLCESYDCNVGLAERKIVVRRAGHHQIDDQHGWLIGETWVGHGSVQPDVANKHQIVTALHHKGDENEWLRFTRETWEHDEQSWIVRWFLGVTFAAPVLRFIAERTFFVHHYSQGGAGKSLIAFLAQSAWGNYKDGSMSLNMATAESTTEVFKYLSDVPLLLDEMQGKGINVSDFVMKACQETHKARSTQDGGLQNVQARMWRTIIRTTGEQTLAGADTADAGGQSRRAVEVRHPGLTKKHAAIVWQWVEKKEHYGWAGIRFLTKLLDIVNNPKSLGALRRRFSDFTTEVKDSMTGPDEAVRDVDRQLAAIALGEYLMLHWLYDVDKETAIRTALQDAKTVGTTWLRSRDAASTLMSKGLDTLAQHRHLYPQAYADAATEEGLQKLSRLGSKTGLSLVAVTNAGVKCDEIWYIPDGINKVIRDKFQMPPDRFWEELAGAGILNRNKDRLVRQRQITNVFTGGVYVVKADKVFNWTPEDLPTNEHEYFEYDYEDPEDWKELM